MKKKIKYGIIVVVVILAILLIIVGGYKLYERIQLSKIMDIKTEEFVSQWEGKNENSLKDINYLEEKDNKVCTIYSNEVESKYDSYHANTQICPSSYIFFVKQELKGKTFLDKETRNWRFLFDYSVFDVEVYDIKTQAYVKTIDVAKILEQYPEYEADYQFQVFWFDNKEKLRIIMTPPDKSAYDFDTYKWLLIDLETEEFELSERVPSLNGNEKDSIIIEELIAWGDKNKLIVDEGDDDTNETVEYTFLVGRFNNWPGMIEMQISTNQLPKENEKLYTMFPGLKDYIGVDGYSTTLILKEEVARELFLGE